jgi:hypothetical protein
MKTNKKTLQTLRRGSLLLAATLLLPLLAALPAQAATLTVTNTNDSGAGSLRHAVSTAASGDTIVFDLPITDAGHNAGSWTIRLLSCGGDDLVWDGGAIVIDKKLTITGPGADILTLFFDNVNTRCALIAALAPPNSPSQASRSLLRLHHLNNNGSVAPSAMTAVPCICATPRS